jgi:hypothetical protein
MSSTTGLDTCSDAEAEPDNSSDLNMCNTFNIIHSG